MAVIYYGEELMTPVSSGSVSHEQLGWRMITGKNTSP